MEQMVADPVLREWKTGQLQEVMQGVGTRLAQYEEHQEEQRKEREARDKVVMDLAQNAMTANAAIENTHSSIMSTCEEVNCVKAVFDQTVAAQREEAVNIRKTMAMVMDEIGNVLSNDYCVHFCFQKKLGTIFGFGRH